MTNQVKERRRIKLIKPRLQLTLVGVFVGLSGLGFLLQSLHVGLRLSELASTFDPARTQGEHDLLAAYRALNTRQQGALLEVARGMAGHTARRKR